MVTFTGERIVPGADNCEPRFAEKMYLEHIARYKFASQWVKGKRVLDVGCGVGYGSRWLAEHGAESVLAFDLSADAIEHAKTHYAHERIAFEVASAENFDFGERFDVVTCFELIEHVNAQAEVIQCIRRALKEDGVLVISTPRALEQKRTHFHTKEFSKESFWTLLSSSFEQVHFYFQNNHFSTLIGNNKPERLENILSLKEQFTLDQADYFIAVASPSPSLLDAEEVLPVMVMGDDKYVTLLEHDVAILHEAEDHLKLELQSKGEEVATHRHEIEHLRATCEILQRDVEAEREAAARRALEHEQLLGEARRLREEKAASDSKSSELEHDLERLRADYSALKAEALARNAAISRCERDLEHLRAEHANLKDYMMVTEAIGENNERDLKNNPCVQCPDCMASRAELENSNAARIDLEYNLKLQRSDNIYLNDVLSAIQNSRSWRLTAPYRYVGRNLKVPMRLLRKGVRHWRQYGIRSLVGAVKRGLKRNHVSGSAQLASSAHSQGSAVDAVCTQEYDVVYAIGCWEGESKRYRVYNLSEGLSKLGYRIKVIPFEQIATLADQGVKASVVVLFRAPYDQNVGIERFLRYAKTRGIKVVFDVDDLVFDPDIIGHIDGFRALSPEEQQRYIDGVHQYRELLMASDLLTVPTEYLRARAESLGKAAFVIPNSINEQQEAIATAILAQPRAEREVVRIGYFSGSYTHQADFAQCQDGLLAVMQKNPAVVFRVVGFLDLDSRWNAFADRVERLDFQPYQDMLRALGECDINIAPLDLNSVFCHGKSELKFFEAGLLGIPTVASATDTYKRAIVGGVDGFVVESADGWEEALSALVVSAELRHQIGACAREVALKRYLCADIAQGAADVYGLRSSAVDSFPETHLSEPPPAHCLRISWVIPGLIIGGGGHRNILRAAYFLAKFGHQIHLYFVGTEVDPQTLKGQIQEHFYPLDCPVSLFRGSIRPSDVVFATHWSTVNAALTARGVAREIMYFVQDFEPAFAPMGTEYVLAENTYRLGLYHITSGPWCETILKRDFHAEADHFQFPVDRSIYYPRQRTKSNRNLVFFAKPEMPRRCFELGIMALREFHRLRPDVEIVMFGSKHASKQSYEFPVTIREIVPTLDDLAQMYSNGDVGLVFSTTNPSLIPYEMMACGLPVVDLDRGDNEVNYASRRDIALLANPLPEVMATEIAALLENSSELAARREKGLEFINSFPSEEGMARKIEQLIHARIGRRP